MKIKRNRVSISFKDVPQITVQSAKEECDINHIMKRALKGGALPIIDPSKFTYGDFTKVKDFASAQLQILEANELFDSLPSNIREHFKNDPAALVAAVSDVKQRDKLIELGLIQKPVKSQPNASNAISTPSQASSDGKGNAGTSAPKGNEAGVASA